MENNFVYRLNKSYNNLRMLYEKKCRKLFDPSGWTQVARVKVKVISNKNIRV